MGKIQNIDKRLNLKHAIIGDLITIAKREAYFDLMVSEKSKLLVLVKMDREELMKLSALIKSFIDEK